MFDDGSIREHVRSGLGAFGGVDGPNGLCNVLLVVYRVETAKAQPGTMNKTAIGIEAANRDSRPAEFSFHLQGETSNCYQGDKCRFDIEVLATETAADDPDDLFPLGMKSIRLENKDTTTWEVIPDDDIYGLINYWVGSDWGGKLIVKGLNATSWYFLTLQGEWPEDGQSTTDKLLGQLNAADPPVKDDPSTGGGIG